MSQWHDFTGLIPAMFTTFFYYGVMQIAIDVENPFNFADVDYCVEIKVLRRVRPPRHRRDASSMA